MLEPTKGRIIQLRTLDNEPRHPKEEPHPLRKIPGVGNECWNAELGRWVVYRR